MSDGRDPAIKLFGSTIPLPELGEEPERGEGEDLCREIRETEVRAHMSDVTEELDQCEPTSTSGLNNVVENDCQTSTQEVQEKGDCKPDEDRAEPSTPSQVKFMKKPDKILPCPRCNSLDTKFCYYNNYNVNQPRHFCKNCQRYWTAGGTMRNVPVGAGRRKNRHSVSLNCPVVMLSDGTPCTHLDAPDSAPDSAPHHALSGGSSATPTRSFKGNGAVLKFGPEAPDCESMTFVLDPGDQKRNAEMSAMNCGEKQEEPINMSSMTASNHVENDCPEAVVHKEQNVRQDYCNGVTPMRQLPCYSGPPFVFPWSPGWSNFVAMLSGPFSSDLFKGPESGNPNSAPLSPPVLASPAFFPPAIAFPFMPASFWSCMSSWPNGAWNVPWLGSHSHLSPSSLTSNWDCPENGLPTLGKHSRDADLEREEKTERKFLWAPKTLRIDDPDEAAKSSIWDTLGIKPDELFKKRGIFKAFQVRTESKGTVREATQVSHANPAALCRSQTFQEST